MQELDHPGILKDYRVCPGCNGRFTPDTRTKYRQALAILLALISLGLTLMLFIDGAGWLGAALGSYLVLGLWIYWGNRHIFLVPYRDD